MAKRTARSRESGADPSRASRSSRRLVPPPGGVAVRMYRQGLGDCFLLAFAGVEKSKPTYVLIDCGVHIAQSGGRDTMAKVVDDIVQATSGHLHVVVATHEHLDHLSAFVHEADRFLSGELTIDRLWLAWTEDERDPIAQELRRGQAAAKEAVEAALKKLRQNAIDDRAAMALAPQLDAALSFFRLESHESDAHAALASRLGIRDPSKVTTNELALAVLKDRVKAPDYLRPGQSPIPLPGAASSRAFVLGPPADKAFLKRSDPSSGDRHETYLTSSVGLLSFAAAASDGASGDRDASQHELCFPFDERFRRDPRQATHRHFFSHHYGLDPESHPLWWRRIDTEWLHAAEELALHLDRHTNNTSLTLAFELGEAGKGPVLLFVGDAQVGNWLSWKSLRWQVAGRRVRVVDLLRRTALYKVGHHASHNATLRRDSQGGDYGLELMPEGLIALIPVDQAAASKLRGWEMPHSRLYQALHVKTRGNILRSDDGHDADLPIPRTRFSNVPGRPEARWRRSTVKKKGGGALYYDLTFRVES